MSNPAAAAAEAEVKRLLDLEWQRVQHAAALPAQQQQQQPPQSASADALEFVADPNDPDAAAGHAPAWQAAALPAYPTPQQLDTSVEDAERAAREAAARKLPIHKAPNGPQPIFAAGVVPPPNVQFVSSVARDKPIHVPSHHPLHPSQQAAAAAGSSATARMYFTSGVPGAKFAINNQTRPSDAAAAPPPLPAHVRGPATVLSDPNDADANADAVRYNSQQPKLAAYGAATYPAANAAGGEVAEDPIASAARSAAGGGGGGGWQSASLAAYPSPQQLSSAAEDAEREKANAAHALPSSSITLVIAVERLPPALERMSAAERPPLFMATHVSNIRVKIAYSGDYALVTAIGWPEAVRGFIENTKFPPKLLPRPFSIGYHTDKTAAAAAALSAAATAAAAHAADVVSFPITPAAVDRAADAARASGGDVVATAIRAGLLPAPSASASGEQSELDAALAASSALAHASGASGAAAGSELSGSYVTNDSGLPLPIASASGAASAAAAVPVDPIAAKIAANDAAMARALANSEIAATALPSRVAVASTVAAPKTPPRSPAAPALSAPATAFLNAEFGDTPLIKPANASGPPAAEAAAVPSPNKPHPVTIPHSSQPVRSVGAPASASAQQNCKTPPAATPIASSGGASPGGTHRPSTPPSAATTAAAAAVVNAGVAAAANKHADVKKLPGHPYANSDDFVGLKRPLSLDTPTKSLVLSYGCNYNEFKQFVHADDFGMVNKWFSGLSAELRGKENFVRLFIAEHFKMHSHQVDRELETADLDTMVWLKKKYDGAALNNQVLPYPAQPVNFWQHLCAFEATIRWIREMWTLKSPTVMRGFLTFDECKGLAADAPVGSFFFRLSNSEPDKLVLCYKNSKGFMNQSKHSAFASLAALKKFIESRADVLLTVFDSDSKAAPVTASGLMRLLTPSYTAAVHARYDHFASQYRPFAK